MEKYPTRQIHRIFPYEFYDRINTIFPKFRAASMIYVNSTTDIENTDAKKRFDEYEKEAGKTIKELHVIVPTSEIPFIFLTSAFEIDTLNLGKITEESKSSAVLVQRFDEDLKPEFTDNKSLFEIRKMKPISIEEDLVLVGLYDVENDKQIELMPLNKVSEILVQPGVVTNRKRDENT